MATGASSRRGDLGMKNEDHALACFHQAGRQAGRKPKEETATDGPAGSRFKGTSEVTSLLSSAVASNEESFSRSVPGGGW